MSNRRRTSRAFALTLPVMPDRTVAFLTYTAGALFTVYIAFVVVTISLATMQTGLAAEVRETEGTIAQLETSYYTSISRENAATPASAGLVAPAAVLYATARTNDGLSLAGR